MKDEKRQTVERIAGHILKNDIEDKGKICYTATELAEVAGIDEEKLEEEVFPGGYHPSVLADGKQKTGEYLNELLSERDLSIVYALRPQGNKNFVIHPIGERVGEWWNERRR